MSEPLFSLPGAGDKERLWKMKMIRKLTFVVLAALLLAPLAALYAADVTNLRCEYLNNPLGIDVARPRLSWVIESTRRGARQTAYQVLVASSEELLKQNKGDVWDSGKVESDRQNGIEYSGKPLGSSQQVYWKVHVWLASLSSTSEEAKSEGESKTASWTTGLLKPADWSAKWITMKVSAGLPHPWMRRTFEVKSEVKDAVVYVNTPAHYELYINGQRVGTDVLAPSHVNLKKRFLYNAYNVSGLLKKGRNCIALWMGPGWYQPVYGNSYMAPIVRAQLEIHGVDGATVIGTDTSWRATDSCISQVGPWAWNNMGGECWDDAKYRKDWNQADFDDSGWASAVEIPAPEGKFRRDQGASPAPRLTASSSFPGYQPALAVDGSDDTRWISNGNKPGMGPNAEKPEYLQFDYDQAQAFAGLYLKPYPACGPKDIEIQCSDDGVAYRTIQRATGQPDREIMVNFDEVRSAHFRIVFLSSYPFRGDKSWNVQVADLAMLGRKELESLKSAAQIEHSWQAIPGSRLRSPIFPSKIYAHKDKWVVDFGTTLVGWMRLRMAGLKPGQQISIKYADSDNPALQHAPDSDGFQTFNQQDMFIAGNESAGVFCSKFNQHAFRYAVISGLSQAPDLKDAEAMMVETDLEPAGDFSCSNDLFNRIHQVTLRTYHTQMPCGVLGGGESREKLGYGDGGSFLTGLLYNMRSEAFYRKWLRDWCDGQTANGFLGHTAPEYYPAGGGPSWGGQASELTKRLDLYYGDSRSIEVAYPVLRRYVDHLESHTENDILRYFNPYNPGQYLEWYFLGDWNQPGASADTHDFVFESALQREFFNNCYRVLLWQDLADFAGRIGNTAEQKRCKDRLAVLRPHIHKAYFDPEKNSYRVSRQSYLVIALLARIMPDEMRPLIFKQLENDIVVTKKGHLDVGLQGSYMLLDLLAKENRPDLAALIMSQETFPGWGFLLKERKVTTWPESWSGWGSQIIQVVGTPGAWFYEGFAGIRPDPAQPGFKHFSIRPGIVDSLSWVKCHYDSIYGRIVSNWKREGDKLAMDVTIPPNTTATVYVQSKDAASVTESGKPIDKAEGVKFRRMENGCAVFEIGSGHYSFDSQLPLMPPKQ